MGTRWRELGRAQQVGSKGLSGVGGLGGWGVRMRLVRSCCSPSQVGRADSAAAPLDQRFLLTYLSAAPHPRGRSIKHLVIGFRR